MNLRELLNDWTEVLFGVGIVDCQQKASQSKVAAQKAEKLAHKKHLTEAVQIAEKTLDAWSSHPGFWERLMRRLLLGNLLKQLKAELEQWRRQLAEAEQLAIKATALLKTDTGNPMESQVLLEVIALSERYLCIVHDERVLQAINQYKEELQWRRQFQGLEKEAKAQAEKRYFKRAIATYREAEQLYPTDAVKAAIATCKSQIKNEETYETALKQAQQASREGKLKGAIALLESALTNFPRADGIELLEPLKRTVKGREKFRAGMYAEKLGALKEAASMYQEAKVLLSDPTECQIRLGLVAIKGEKWAVALSHLEGVHRQQAAYLRGFAQAKQGNLQQAHREWQSLTQAAVESQREILKSLAQRQRLLGFHYIEQQVKDESWEEAKAASLAFIQKFGSDPLVQGNLDDHIQPRLETAVWQSSGWATITDTVKRVWIEQPNLTSLHNWAVATYYRAYDQPIESRGFYSLLDLIMALSTASANLRQDPALQNVPWLGNTPVDYDSVSSDLLRRLEEVIDACKDKDINRYLQLRDRYRLEVVALRLMGNPPAKGLRVKGVYVTPGCYELFKEKLKDITLPKQLWGTLYTSWGLAVAACVEGDTQRAIKIKPLSKPVSEVESFAQKFVAYHEGCYLLQQQKWREAMTLLKQAQIEIKFSTTWYQEVERLCGLQRQAISEFREHLEFAQFWYDLLGSQPARSYLAEYKAEQLREKLVNKQISDDSALRELQEIKQIDQSNPVVSDLIEEVELHQELEVIQRLVQNGQYEEIVSRARRSRRERVRYKVAEFFIDILLNGVNSGKLKDAEAIRQLGRWAYEICPNEPAFQEVYRQLGLRY